MKRLILALALVFGALGASAQPRVYLSTTNGVYVIQSLQIGGQTFTNLTGLGLTNDQGVLKVVGGGSGTGNADTNAPNGWSQKQTFAGGIDAPGTNILGVLHVTAIESDTPIDQSIGGTGGTNAATAQAALGLQPDVDVQAYRLALKQVALAMLADGDMPYINSSGVATNTPSLAYGRSLLNTLDAAAARALLGAVYGGGDTMTGHLKLPTYAYDAATWTNGSRTNEAATRVDVANKIEQLAIGGTFFSSVSSDFTNAAGQLQFAPEATAGTGKILRETAAGTNSQLNGLSDVTVSNPLPGQSLIVSSGDTNKWVNGFPSKLEESDYWQEQFTPITGGASGITGALTPFGNSSISGGAAPTMNATYAGRYGVVLLKSATSTNWYTGGAIGFSGAGSGFDSTYIMQLRSDAILVLTNDLYGRVGYTDQMSNNGPGDAVNFLVTNGVIRGEAIQGGTSNITQTATGFTASSNVWYTFKVFKTNTTAHFRLYTNRTQLAWEDSVTSNVPTNGQLLMPMIIGMAGGNGATNKILMGVDNFGYRQTVQ